MHRRTPPVLITSALLTLPLWATAPPASAATDGATDAGRVVVLYGAAVAVVTGGFEQVLLVGVPDDVSSSTGLVDVIPLGGGSPRAWVPGAGGVPVAGGERFGATVAGGGQQ